MTKRKYVTAQIVEVTLKEDAFTPEFMSEFRQSFYNFTTLEEHSEHIAQMYARGLYDPICLNIEFIEGYGPIKNFVESLSLTDFDIDRVSDCGQTITNTNGQHGR